MANLASSVILDAKGEPTEFTHYGVRYLVSGSCNGCGKCCAYYLTHGYKGERTKDDLPCFDKATNKCRIQDTKPDFCRKYPGGDSFIYMPKECSYIIKRADTGEVMKYNLEDQMDLQKMYPYAEGTKNG